MKKNIFNELKNENMDQLNTRLKKERDDFAQLRLELQMKKLKDTRKLFHKRKDISKILTLINEKRSKK